MGQSIVIYHLWLQDEAKGPFTISQLRSMWNSGKITGETNYTIDSGETWYPLLLIVDDLEPVPIAPLPAQLKIESQELNVSDWEKKEKSGKFRILIIVILLLLIGGSVGSYKYYQWIEEKRKHQLEADSYAYALRIKLGETLLRSLLISNEQCASAIQQKIEYDINGYYGAYSNYQPTIDKDKKTSRDLLDKINNVLMSKVESPPSDGIEAHNKLVELCGIAESNQGIVFNPSGTYNDYVEKCNSSFEAASKVLGEIDAIYPNDKYPLPNLQESDSSDNQGTNNTTPQN